MGFLGNIFCCKYTKKTRIYTLGLLGLWHGEKHILRFLASTFYVNVPSYNIRVLIMAELVSKFSHLPDWKNS